MRNPWLKKNPFMSAWLSAANAAVSAAQATATAAAKRQSAAAMTQAGREVAAFWADAFAAPPARSRKRRSKK